MSEKGLDCRSILIIDDEADNASITTSKDPEKPTTINRCIRDIFNKFPIASYVGYTATPFANIFINPYDDESYLDLFPTDFIAQLHAPSTYFGGRLVFPKNDTRSKYVRLISENEPNFLPVVHDKYVSYPAMAESLKEAINSFVICNVIRTLRGHGLKHRSMMINITRYNDPQALVWERVTEYLDTLRNAIEQLSDMPIVEFCKNRYCNALYELYQNDDFFKEIREGNPDSGTTPVTWKLIQQGLYEEIKKFIVVVINSRNGQMNNIDPSGRKKRFDYDDKKDEGARVIAIGGMVLSRGLTLEGLMTSYYSRNAGAYDTLLQMCRWFGYRPKYMDLCRIYLTQVSIDQFDAVLSATEDLKEQFSEMKLRDKKPIDFGLMIKECPDTLETTLLITSRNKMYNSGKIVRVLNYGGTYADTSKLFCSKDENAKNGKVVRSLIAKCLEEGISWHDYYAPYSEKSRKMFLNVPRDIIASHIKQLSIPYENTKFDVDNLSTYISESCAFPSWDIVVASGEAENVYFEGQRAVARSFRKSPGEKYIRIGDTNNRIIDPGIFVSGLNSVQHEIAKLHCEERREKQGKSREGAITVPDYLAVETRNPLFVIYPIQLKTVREEEKPTEEEKRVVDMFGTESPVFGFAIGFPSKESAEKLTYRANKVKIHEIEESRDEPEVDEEFYDND